MRSNILFLLLYRYTVKNFAYLQILQILKLSLERMRIFFSLRAKNLTLIDIHLYPHLAKSSNNYDIRFLNILSFANRNFGWFEKSDIINDYSQ